MLGVFRYLAILAATAVFLTSPSFSEEPDAFTAGALKGRIVDSKALNTPGMVIVQSEDLPELLAMSANGRWVMRGSLYDTWTGRKVQSVAEVREASATMPLDHLWPKLNDLAPLVVGEGPSEVMVWVDPQAGPSRQLLKQLEPLGGQYKFFVLVIPVLGDQAEEDNRRLTCASDRDAAMSALISGEGVGDLEQDPSCNLAPAHTRLVTAQLLGLQGVPVVIARSGRFNNGVPRAGLEAWLEGAR